MQTCGMGFVSLDVNVETVVSALCDVDGRARI